MGPCLMGLAWAQVVLERFDPNNVQEPNDWSEEAVVGRGLNLPPMFRQSCPAIKV